MLHVTGTMNRWLSAIALLGLAGVATAADGRVIDAPPPPPPLQSGEPLEPEVTIRRSAHEVVYEYRQNGQLVLVRVQPRFGPPYHFVDANGDGELDYRPGEPVRHDINQWMLFRW